MAALELTCNMEKGWDELFACFDSFVSVNNLSIMLGWIFLG